MSAEPVRPTDCSEFRLRVYEYIDQEMTAADCARVRAQLQLRRTSMSQQQQAERLRLIVDSMDEGEQIDAHTSANDSMGLEV